MKLYIRRWKFILYQTCLPVVYFWKYWWRQTCKTVFWWASLSWENHNFKIISHTKLLTEREVASLIMFSSWILHFVICIIRYVFLLKKLVQNCLHSIILKHAHFNITFNRHLRIDCKEKEYNDSPSIAATSL